jgi:methyl-accepting chemotaxis protein
MSALARQTALRLEQHQRETFHPQVSAAGIALSRRQQELALLWQEQQQTCQTLTQDATAQIIQVETAIAQMETNIDRVQMLNATLHQTQGQVEQSHHLLEESQATIGQAMTTMTEIQETMVAAGVGARQLDEFCQKIEEISIQLKSLTDQINYQAMNATIESGRQSDGADWSPAFSNQIVQLTRQVRRCTNTLESLSADITTEAQSLANITDTASEQVLVGAEWFKDTRQKLGQLTAINAKMESLAERMTDNNNEQLQSTNDTHHTLFEIANLANATVAQASEMVQAMTQYNQAG